MNRLTQEARKRQGAVKWAAKYGKSAAARQYGVSLSSIKRWSKRYDGSWQSLVERSHRPHRPHSHPRQHSAEEEQMIREAFSQAYLRYGWDGVYAELVKSGGYSRSFGGMYHAATRMGLGRKRPPRVSRRYPELTTPGEKVQIDVKDVLNCKGVKSLTP